MPNMFYLRSIVILASLVGLIGGIALPITLAYPSFMWIVIKKPKKYNTKWYLNWTLGVVVSVLVITGARRHLRYTRIGHKGSLLSSTIITCKYS
ncbi:hypothetical protein Lalb_Chr11g0061711 [Lupinus albus]|uniref:Amino acid transporter, transmembrane domain-containing protein n=1 Tax=Lupinus albus TaxID=3870 RepID=A0A6A4PPP3_LUPAL|nr:hypothetical protein Lalb_Chr11g0061711 [Lupinus albus]